MTWQDIQFKKTVEITGHEVEAAAVMAEEVRFGEVSPEYDNAIAYTVPPEVEEAEKNLQDLKKTDEEQRAALFK